MLVACGNFLVEIMEEFAFLRMSARLPRDLCADYFRVNLSTVTRWDNGTSEPPFAVCELLRVLSGYVPALSARQGFKGWRFDGDTFISPEGDTFQEHDLRGIRLLYDQAAAYRREIRALKKELEQMRPTPQPLPDNVVAFPRNLSKVN
jgi:Phage protein